MRRSRTALCLSMLYACIGLAGVWVWWHANDAALTWHQARSWGKLAAIMAMPWYLIPVFIWPTAPRSLTTVIEVLGIVVNAGVIWLAIGAWSRRSAGIPRAV